jgi:hypothetical protein
MWKKGDIVNIQPISENGMIDEVLPNDKYRLKRLATAGDILISGGVDPDMDSFREIGVFSADELEPAHQ